MRADSISCGTQISSQGNKKVLMRRLLESIEANAKGDTEPAKAVAAAAAANECLSVAPSHTETSHVAGAGDDSALDGQHVVDS